MYQILCGNARKVLSMVPSNSIDCVVTSPPYFGLRSYNSADQIGLEVSFGDYMARLVEVFQEVRRVMKATATLWINMGDSWVNDGGSGQQGETGDRADRRHTQNRLVPQNRDLGLKPKSLIGQPWRLAFALQEKDLVLRQELIWEKPTATPESARDRPTRSHETIFLFTKQPQYYYDQFAVMEACTGNSHKRGGGGTKARGLSRADGVKNNLGGRCDEVFAMRNLRSVWKIPANPFGDEWCTGCRTLYSAAQKKKLARDEKGRLICKCGRVDAWVAHFATFPRELARRCIAAGSSESGCCMWCGAPHERIVERPTGRDNHPNQALKGEGVRRVGKVKSGSETAHPDGPRRMSKIIGLRELTDNYRQAGRDRVKGKILIPRAHDVKLPAPRSIGWRPTCGCRLGGTIPAKVLDPFAGACTTLLVAEQLGRDSIGIELNQDYCNMAEARIRRELLHGQKVAKEGTDRRDARSAS